MCKRIIRDSYYSYKAMFSYYGVVPYFLYKIVNSFFQICFFALFSIYLFGKENATDWIVGNAFMLSSCNSLFGVGVNTTYERIFGTLKYEVASSSDIIYRYLLQIIIHIFDGIFNIMLGILYGILFFNIEIDFATFVKILAIATISMISIACFSLFIGNIGLIIRDMSSILNFINMIIMICAGVNYPIERMPKVLRVCGEFLPLSGGIMAARRAISGNESEVWKMIVHEIAIGGIYFATAVILYKIIESLAIKNARIDLM